MALPTIASVGTLSGGSGPLTLTAGSFAANDILLAFYTVEQNETVSLTTANGFVQTDSSPQTAVIAGGIKIHCFWKRATSSSDPMPVTFDPTDHIGGFVVAVRGCTTSGNPWNTSSGGAEAVADNSLSIPGATTSVANCLVVACVADGVFSTSTARWTGWTNADLANVTEIADGGGQDGGGWGFGAVTGEMASPGTYGATTSTFFTNSYKAYMTLALAPAVGLDKTGGGIIGP